MNEVVVELSNSRTKIFIGSNKLEQIGKIISKNFKREKQSATVVIVTNNVVFKLFGGKIEESFLNVGFKVLIFKLRPGEKFKNFRKVF